MCRNRRERIALSVIQDILRFLDAQGEVPALYGSYHVISLVIMVLLTVWFCKIAGKHDAERVRRVVLWTAIIVVILEVYKQVNYSFGYEDGITFDYLWYAFPWQFCSTPMYVGLLAGLTKPGKLHDALCAYLATFAIFAGLAVMLYPGNVYTSTVGINFQTTVCHGSMVVIGGYLYASGHVKMEHKTILKALPVFCVTAAIAIVLNEIGNTVGLSEQGFNMFYFSPYGEPNLPVYSSVQQVVDYPWSLIIYIVGFTGLAYLMLLIAMGIGKLAKKKTKVAA